MGKWTDKMYVTAKEWATDFGGAKGAPESAGYKRLPYYCCSLSLQPFEHPVCTPEGVVFDILSIVPWIKERGMNPVTGEPLETKGLTRLHFHRNSEGKYHCPITFKVFNEHTRIVAIRTSGNVYAYDAVRKLNLEGKNFRDLISDEPFDRSDIINIQDPQDVEQRDISKFYYVQKGLKLKPTDEGKKSKDSSGNNLTSRVIHELSMGTKTIKTPSELNIASTSSIQNQNSTAHRSMAHYSTGVASGSLTSTSMTPVTANDRATIAGHGQMYKKIKRKGYILMKTNLGDLHLELHCDLAPKACHNLILLAKSGYYNGIRFHRNVKDFMIQGGDPTGTGRGGESFWKEDFEDEIKSRLSHDSRGVLSMANSGRHTNGSQFFITYKPCDYLDGKHTIFGKVDDHWETLDKMEQIQCDKNDVPMTDIVIESIVVQKDPFEEYQKWMEKSAEVDLKSSAQPNTGKNINKVPQPSLAVSDRVVAATFEGETSYAAHANKKRKVKSNNNLQDFSAW